MDNASIEAIEAEQLPSGELVAPGFHITDRQTADWGLRRKAECEAEIEEIERQYEAAVAMLVARKEKLQARARGGVVFFDALLTEYAQTHRGDLIKGTRKSADFLHGRISYRKKAERLEVVDKDALVAWLSAQPVESGLYRVKVEPEMRAIQERFKETGEVPPGMDVKPAEETVTVEAVAPERALKE